MAKIFLIENAGSALLINDDAYELVTTKEGFPTNTIDEVQYSSITGITHNYADAQGKTVYTPGERALAFYEYGCRGVGPLSYGWIWTEVYEALQPGVLRAWGGNGLYVNRIFQFGLSGGEANGKPVNLTTGDLVEVLGYSGYVIYFTFLPFVC